MLGLGSALLAGLAFSGCGGSGGDDGGPPEYHVLALERDVVGDTVRSFSVRYAIAEAGTLRGGEGYSSATGGLDPQPDLPFAVDAARTLTASPAWGAPVAGRMSEDLVFGAATPAAATGDEPALLLAVRRNPAPTLDDLVGEWFVCRFRRRPGAVDGSSVSCSTSAAQISPLSTFVETDDPDDNDDGVVNGGPPTFSTFQSVVLHPGGWVGIEGPGEAFRGSLSVDGNVLLLGTVGSGFVGVPGDAEVRVLVRRGLASDTSEAVGAHAVAGFQRSGTAFASLAGSATFAGLSGGTTSLVGNVDGAATPSFFPDLGSFMQVSGKSFVDLGSLDLRGAAGPAGRWLVLVGGFTNGDEPGLYLFVR